MFDYMKDFPHLRSAVGGNSIPGQGAEDHHIQVGGYEEESSISISFISSKTANGTSQ
jgi:hypothetical protein